jgi:Mce-associated membrane protein
VSENPTGGASPQEDTAAPSGRWLGRPVTVVLAVVVAAALVVLALELAVLRPRVDDAQAEQQARADVIRTAERFTAQVNNYDASAADRFAQQVRPLLSPKFRADYEQVLQQISTEITKSRMTSKGEVLASGVASVDEDSAQVLVVADASATTVYGPRDRHFRWEIDLVKLGGRWLVDNFTPVA